MGRIETAHWPGSALALDPPPQRERSACADVMLLRRGAEYKNAMRGRRWLYRRGKHDDIE